jgi:hypothetical protein
MKMGHRHHHQDKIRLIVHLIIFINIYCHAVYQDLCRVQHLI